MKLPEKKYEPKHCKTLAEYAQGWNSMINDVKYMCNKYDDEHMKKELLKSQEYYSNRKEMPYFKGIYDCIVEIERLNAEDNKEARDVYNDMFSDSLEALNKLNIQPKKSLLVIDEPSVCSECDLFAKAIETYGDTLQKVVTIEELSELQKEICKDLRNNGSNPNKDAIIEEIVDVQIMINQLFIIYGINQDEFESEYRRKMERLEKRINESNIGLL